MYKVVNSDPLFEVTCDGRVRRTDNLKHPKPWYDKDGYARIYATENGVKHYVAVHRAVAEAWCLGSGEVVNHIDGDISNNYYTNLEWTTHAGNTQHSYALGLQVPIKGERHGRSKHTECQILKVIDLLGQGFTYTQVADTTGIPKHTVYRVMRGSSWAHLPRMSND